MRVVHAAALTAAALLLTSITSAQGLGDTAAREREKRKAAPAKPAKVYTDQEVASSPVTSADVPAESVPEDSAAPAGSEAPEGSEAQGTATATDDAAATDAATATDDAAATEEAATPAEEQTPEQKAAAAEAKAAADEAEAKAKAQADWRAKLDAERRKETQQKEMIDKINAQLGDLSGFSYGANRARRMEQLEQTKQKLAETQANIARLEDEGRRNGYR